MHTFWFMKRLIIILALLLTAINSQAQTHEIALFLGGSNFVGDVGDMDYVKPTNFAIGGVYKWNRHPRFSYRASIMYTKLEDHDADSEIAARRDRGFYFENNILEFSGGIEFNFLDFNQHDGKAKITPYVFTGLSYFLMDQLTYDMVDPEAIKYQENVVGSLAIPMIVGIKTNAFRNLVLGFEVGARYTFTDNIDGNDAPGANNRFGNPNSNDWYVFTGMTISVSFKRKPCFSCYQ